ncbi:MAG: class I SAM-dependent methyltransferase [Coriobacteriales bacterium]|nr:class I SAM-dependent methyltransferase [Coriobacteriales bacterium]
MAKREANIINTYADLLAYEEALDRSISGISLGNDEEETRLAEQGAHDPTPTPYFVLEDLFSHYTFGQDSHLLDVGCGAGRVLAFFAHSGFPGHATGVELDPLLADAARTWTSRYDNLDVIQGSALDLDLSPYTDFYLFNPFSPSVLQQFIESIECQVPGPSTVIHMSDNGDTWRYVGRPGWTEIASGSFTSYRNARGRQVKVYDHPQHYTVWRYQGQ